MSTFNPTLTSDPNNPTYNFGMAERYSYVPVNGDNLNRPLYAQASYLINPGDINANAAIPGFNIPTFDAIQPTYYPNTTNFRTVAYSYRGTLVATLSFSYLDASTNGSPFTQIVRI
jgi:hypothetical protein